MILVDYRCGACAVTTETLTCTPVPPHRLCPRCGGDAHRRYGAAGLTGRATAPAAGSTACVDNPDVPGLCHVGPAAKRTLIARHRGDTDTLAREQQRQRAEYERSGPPDSGQIRGHSHSAPARSGVVS
ncbi:hypothetical protein R4282_26875 [Rhodococcus oxybenzonivorans]|jgi:hypothetical protein|uniref:hypothetical protein n=1 Tax=Rhodococcus TaxID=1827 RepID=UPI0013202B31|nr:MULTISPECIES: hypothetical protein [Rhodococcus]MDV7356626.1 hypothetical protein [Rhodococcus oxybenzonivorans]QHE70854.1 hypothetical protein GFS60_04445 [Rhodococcus sp. WAY2]